MGWNYSSYILDSSSPTPPVKPDISHVIFDFDGILVHSEDQYSKSMQAAILPYGKQFTLEQKLKIMGSKKREAIVKLLTFNDLLEKVDFEAFLSDYCVHLEKFMVDCPVLPGAERIIQHLHKTKVPMAICTGSDDTEFELKTRKSLQHWLDIIKVRVLSGSDPEVKNGKPSPDPYNVTFKRLPDPPVSPANCLVFEDSVNGAISALNAGMQCILIPQKEFMCEETEECINTLRPRLADVLESLEDFRPEHYGLPAFQ